MSAAQLFGRRFERTRRKSPAVHNLQQALPGTAAAQTLPEPTRENVIRETGFRGS
jgi:hypothetical protein